MPTDPQRSSATLIRRFTSSPLHRLAVAALAAATTIAGAASPVDAAGGGGNASINLTKTVAGTTMTPNLSLTLGVDKASAIPGDKLTYSSSVSNTGASLTLTGQFIAQNNGNNVPATVSDYYDEVEYLNASTKVWTPLAGFQATASGYTPVIPSPATTGMTLTLVHTNAAGVTYPTTGDQILGTQIGAAATAGWNYTAVLPLSPSQIATLSNSSKVSNMRNVVHFEVTPRAVSIGQPFTYRQEFTDPFLSNPATVGNIVVTITLPDASQARFDSTNTHAFVSLASGASATVSTVFTVPAAAGKAPGQSDADYLRALRGLEGSALTASATATGSATGGTVTAPPPAPVTTIEHLPIVTIDKKGPSTVAAGTPETNPLTLNNSGGATASGLAVVDAVPSGTNGTVSSLPATLAPGANAPATATYQVPAGQAAGSLTDTASLTWQDANGNNYGPVSSDFTTTVSNNLSGATLTLSPSTAGPDVVGTSQKFTATLLDHNSVAIAGQAVMFSVTGANPKSQAATTDANGIATFSYGGTNNGADQVQASVSSGSISLQSNTVTLNWIIPVVPASTSTVNARFYQFDPCNCLSVNPSMTPIFTMQLPTININPPTGSIPHMPPSIGSFNRPMVSVSTDVLGNFTGATVVQGTDVNGVLHQAGGNATSGDMGAFQAVFTGSLTVANGGNLRLSFFVDDGFVLGMGGGVTYVSGFLENAYPSGVMPFSGFPIVGAFNRQSGPEERDVTVNFPAPGTYPYEIDYFECCGDGLAMTFGDGGNSGMPPTGNLALSPITLPAKNAGQSVTVSVAAMDASGVALPNLGIDLGITGANPQHLPGTTDSTGYATFTYQSVNAGVDTLQATSTVSGVFELSNVVTMTWNPAPPAPTITLPSPLDGSLVTKPIPVSATFAPPAGQTIASWAVTYQALDPGPVVPLNSGTGTPPATLATFDPTTLPNGQYAINISATASGGGVQTITTTVIVSGYLKPGRYVTTYQDMNVPVFGFQMQVRRTYDSFDKEQGDFGIGWHVEVNNFRVSTNHTLGAGGWVEYNTQCALGLCLTAMRNTAPRFVSIVFPDQHTEVFDFSANGGTNLFFAANPVYTARPGTGTTSTLQAVGDGTLGYQDDGNLYSGSGQIYDPQQFKLTLHDGTVLVLDRTAGLVSITDRAGEQVQASPSGFHSPNGIGITFTRDSLGRISQITGPSGQVLKYQYTGGDLTSFTDAVGNVTTFEYDGQDNLLRANGPAGQPLQTETYDASGRLISITDANGNTARISNDVAGRQQKVVDPTGRLTTVFTLDDLGDVVRQDQLFDGKTLTSTATYDAVGRPLTRTDPLGHTWSATYDSNGNLLSMTDPQHNAVSVTYDDFGAPLTFTDPIGNISRYAYDAQGNLTTFTNALGQSDHYGYGPNSSFVGAHTDALNRTWSYNPDGAGNINTIVNPLHDTTRYSFNGLGEMTAIIDPSGATTSYAYDAAGNLLTVTDALNHVTTLTYNALNELATRTDALGKTTTYTYDGNRAVLSETDPLGHVTSYTYDADGRLATVTDPTGGVTTYTYDGAGRLASESDQLHRVTSYTYDDAGRMLTKTMPNGGVFTYGYDTAGHETSVTDPLGHKTTNAYDADGRLVSVTDPLGNTATYTLDALGRQVQVTDPLNGVTKHSYDVAGELISVTDPMNNTTTYGYDGDARLASVTDPLGHATSYGYDPNNRSSSVTDPLGRFVIYQDDALGRVSSTRLFSGIFTHQTYDAVGHVSTTSDGLGNTTSYTYDDAGRKATMIDPNGHTTSYGYDAAGRQTSITDALGGKVTTTYDLAGQKTSVVNPRGDTTSFTYDALGDRLTQTDPAGGVTSYAYDLAGRQTSKTDPRGVVITNTYDAADQLTAQSYPGGSNTFVYDALGRRASMTDPTGTTTFGYDAASRLKSVAAPQGTVSYAYDAASNRTSMTIPLRGTITYGYDAANQLTSLTDFANQVFSFTYTADGLPASISRPGGVVTSYGYDGADRLTSVHHDGPSGVIAHYDYTLDAAGNRTSMSTSSGKESYTLDVLNRLASVSYPNGDTASYTYDAAGNRLSSVLNGNTTVNTYDSAGRLAKVGSTPITYDAASNITSVGSDTFSWDWAGLLASSNVSGVAASYAYDGDGIRVGQTIAGTTINYVWDRNASLPLLVDDGTQSYVQTNLGVLEQVGSTTSYPLADALGSVRTVETPTPSVLATTSYDVFGSVRSQSGQQSIFGFTGQQTDSTGLSFLRARYYDPTLGRFLSADSVQPNAPGTQGFNPYAYAANDPTTLSDPTGNDTLTEDVEIETKLPLIVRILAFLGAAIESAYLTVLTVLEIASLECQVFITACLVAGAGLAAGAGVLIAAVLTRPSPRTGRSSSPTSVQPPNPGVEPPVEPAVTIDDAVRQCLRTADFSSLHRTGPADPCHFPPGYNLYFSGSDISATTQHIITAITKKNLPALLHRRAVKPPYREKNAKQNCPGIDSTTEWCDEYPFFSSEENALFDVSWEAVSIREQSVIYPNSQANSLKSFYEDCNVETEEAPYVVIPQQWIPTFHICSDGRIGSN